MRPYAPQLLADVVKGVSQPLAGFPSQSPNWNKQFSPETPLTQVAMCGAVGTRGTAVVQDILGDARRCTNWAPHLEKPGVHSRMSHCPIKKIPGRPWHWSLQRPLRCRLFSNSSWSFSHRSWTTHVDNHVIPALALLALGYAEGTSLCIGHSCT